MKIKKILIANRGEIVLRVLATCREMGIGTVTVFSEVDRTLPHAYQGDESYSLGSGDLGSTYLNQGLLIDIAKKAKVQAIHPGYGFLSENSEFCRKVREAGLIFIGPSPEVLALMGDKKAAKEKASALGVPCLPGYHGENQESLFLGEEAKRIGFPLLIKATAGGGGKGMRLVNRALDFPEFLEAAKREAFKAFSDDKVILEKFIERPRHIEVQVFSDSHGHHLHLFERECSIQRRNQKILEECPSPAVFMTPEKRARLTEEAVKITRSIHYEGAGTIEFLFDEKGEFYFLEMNTRLQVEHPVTEMVTGLDLVKWQILAAQGDKLPLAQKDISLRGHSLEVRIYAEDPDQDFLPTSGLITYVGRPSLRHSRLEVGYQDGDEVSVNFDPMLAKLVVWGENREEARKKMLGCLDEVLFQGPVTNRDFLRIILKDPKFVEGETFTTFIREFWARQKDNGKRKQENENENIEEDRIAALIGGFLLTRSFSSHPGGGKEKEIEHDPWTYLKDFRV